MKRKCAICRLEFEKQRMGQKVCGPKCSIEYVKKQAEKEDRKITREKKDALKTTRDWLKDAQVAFNAYIRERDRALPCISCGRHHTGSHDAGHYRSVGAASHLRFDEDNCHKQCVPCNQHKSGNAIEYRIRLVERIGEERVHRLEYSNVTKKWTTEEAKKIRDTYKRKLKELKNDL